MVLCPRGCCLCGGGSCCREVRWRGRGKVVVLGGVVCYGEEKREKN